METYSFRKPSGPIESNLGNESDSISEAKSCNEETERNSRKSDSCVVDMSDADNSVVSGSVISAHDLSYTVKVVPPGKRCGQISKEILHNVNCIFKPGVNAILGPTGSGKSSMLDLLAGRKNPKGISGHILVDGFKQPKNYKCMTGYVVQDDVVMGTLTIRENFMFSANLRLPSSISKTEKKERVDNIIQELGLTKCADSKVGTEFIRGVSGGERKRTNIGMELIISPKVLFLDEPTTGLDASTANAVIELLHRLSKRGRTIIFSIHQPRFSIFKLFDQLLILASGYVIYHGPSRDTLQFFTSLGFECEAHNNPADFFLDIANGDSTAVTKLKQKKENGASKSDKETNKTSSNLYAVHDSEEKNMAFDLHRQFCDSNWHQTCQQELKSIMHEFENRSKGDETAEQGHYPTSFLQQLWVVSKRTFLNIIRNPQTSIFQHIVVIIFALIVGLIYFQMDNTLPQAIQNRVGAFFFIIMNQVLAIYLRLSYSLTKDLFLYTKMSVASIGCPHTFLQSCFVI